MRSQGCARVHPGNPTAGLPGAPSVMVLPLCGLLRIGETMNLLVKAFLALLSVATPTTDSHKMRQASYANPKVTLCDLMAHPAEYAGKSVTINATVLNGMEFSLFVDDSCHPTFDKTEQVLAKFSSSQFKTKLGKKLSKLLKKRQQARVTIVGTFVDPGMLVGHQLCCRYILEVERVVSVEETKERAEETRRVASVLANEA